MAEPKFSVSQITTIHQTYEQDLATYREAGADGMGVWEFKLGDGQDAERVAQLADSGLKATTCIPGVLSIWPVPFPGPTDPTERTDALCAAICLLPSTQETEEWLRVLSIADVAERHMRRSLPQTERGTCALQLPVSFSRRI